MTLTVSSPLEVLVDEVALECQVLPATICSDRRIPAAVRARRLIAFAAVRYLGMEADDVARQLDIPAQSVRRHIREAAQEARSDVFFSAQLYSLRSSR